MKHISTERYFISSNAANAQRTIRTTSLNAYASGKYMVRRNVRYAAAKLVATEKVLTITIPESLDYSHVFDDIFRQFTSKATLEQVKTTNMGSLFKLKYNITLLKGVSEKVFIDELRVRNGNLEILCSRRMSDSDRLL